MAILKFLRGHLLAVLAVFALLIVQANCELTLPQYMSDIVDVGIQQGGIESAVPTSVRAQSLADLEMFLSDDEVSAVEADYSAANASGIRTFVGRPADKAKGSALAEELGLPETIVLALDKGVDASTLMGSAGEGKTLTMDAVRTAYQAGRVTKDQLVSAAGSMAGSMGAMSGSIVSQRAVEFVRAEYVAQGMDVNAVQTSYLGRMAQVMFAFCLVALLAAVLVGLIASRTGAVIGRDLRHDMFAKVMRFSPAEVSKFSQASLITRSTNDIQQIQQMTVMLMRMVLLAPVMGCVAISKVVATHTGLEWTIMLAVLSVLGIISVLFYFTLPRFKKMQSLIDRVNLVAREILDGLMPIRAFGRQGYELGRFDEASTDLMETQLFTNRAMSLMMPAMMLVMNVITVVIVWFGANGVDAGVMQVGDMMAFISYAMQIVFSFLILAMLAVIAPRASVAAGRVQEVLDCPLTVVDPERPKTVSPDGPRASLVFDDVSFRYPDAEADVVAHVSFTASAGKTTAIIGSTGSGKSSLVQLVPRLYDVTGGRVTLDGIDVRDMSLTDLRGRIGYVPQKGFLFSGTVGSNVAYGMDRPNEVAVDTAIDVAQARTFVSECDEGLETPIAQRGANVSGGQRQRLAIARALAIRPEVLVLDDSFSALDYATDARLRAALATQVANTALVVVAQRIASVMHADQIVVLDEGRVVGRGTHEQLLRTCPTYLEIARSQLSASELGLEGGE
ncbi:MAG: ABC transporter ATP-binding protein [Atopobiaceae bacterium]|jgi:ATP-binding cassette subfamily B protein|nr:ABC transporter ATP-binding protein/permease [Atopobiaceae bacterium]